MKINNGSQKQNKQTGDQQGITLAGRFIPYTWMIGTGGAVIMIALFIGVMVMTGDGANDASAEPETEDVVDGEDEEVGDLTDEMTEEALAEYEAEVDRMWDEYIDESSTDEGSSGDENVDEDAAEDEPDTAEDVPDETEDVQDETASVSDEEMIETIKAFLEAYQIYGAGDTSQARYDRIYPYVTEAVANKLIPNRGVSEAGPSIDVTHELVEIRADAREGVDNEYVATIVYTREAMDEVIQYTDVYSILTEGDRISSVNIRSSTWD